MKENHVNAKRWTFLLAIAILSVLVLIGCNVPATVSPTSGNPVEEAMQTLQAEATQQYYRTLVAQLTATPIPVIQPSPTNTINPTAINQIPTVPVTPIAPTPTKVVVPTAIPATPTRILPSPTPVPCNWAKLMEDVTIPDGTKLEGGTEFTKTWRLKNIGSCTWTTQYDYAFVSGNQMGANNFYDLPKAVKPGETIDISAKMIAPSTAGTYQANFMLVNTNGVRFGVGADAKGVFWVSIVSTGEKNVFYSFADKACDAVWTNSTKATLPCPGKETSTSSGYVVVKATPIREDGGTENEIGLVTRPNDIAVDGYIQGIYPELTIKNGDHFKATVMCEGNSPQCDIKFEVYYQIGTGKPTSMGEWPEKFDGMWTKVDVDLSSFADQKLKFYLVVFNGATAADDKGLWLNPIIYRP